MPRVLVVEDDGSLRNMLREILGCAGLEVETAPDAESAIVQCSSGPSFDLVLSDVVMPGIDGHELARWLARNCPESRVILMSGFDPGCDHCPYVDACQQLSKPFPAHEVLGRVLEALEKPARPRGKTDGPGARRDLDYRGTPGNQPA